MRSAQRRLGGAKYRGSLLARCRTALLLLAVLAPAAARAETCYDDLDGDGYGSTVASCTTSGVVKSGGDCNDGDKSINPGATEIVDDKIDQDCNGYDAVTCYKDEDGDSYGGTTSWVEVDKTCSTAGGVDASTDCDDADHTVHPGATEVCDGVDDDCDGAIDPPSSADALTWWLDADGDGYGDEADPRQACDGPPPGYAAVAGDCDDTRKSVHPEAVEQCNGADDDCDGAIDDGWTYSTWRPDADGDGWGDAETDGVYDCRAPSDDWVTKDGDCDDMSASVHPGADEVCDGADDDCDGQIDEGLDFRTWYADADADGWGDAAVTTSWCAPVGGAVLRSGDCDDRDAPVHPGADEIWYDGVDQDCDGNDVDQDGDGVPEGQDCDDADAGPDCERWVVGGGGGERLPAGCDTAGGASAPALLSLLACVAGMRTARRPPRPGPQG